MPLCLSQIPHTSDMIMETIQGNRIPIETAVVADEVKKNLLSQYRRKLIRMFNKVCQITCRETPGFGLQFQILFFKMHFNIILPFNSNYFQQSLTITSSIKNFVYISSYKVGDSTDLPSTGSVWTGAENLASTEIRSPNRGAHSQSLYRLSYPGPHISLCALQNNSHHLGSALFVTQPSCTATNKCQILFSPPLSVFQTDVFCLLGCYTSLLGSWLPTFWHIIRSNLQG